MALFRSFKYYGLTMEHARGHYDVIVIGGGSAGLMAAGRAGECGKRVLLLEKNEKLGKKLSISGGGRCNITNAEENIKVFLSNYGVSEQFLYSAFSVFGGNETRTFFESQELPLMVEARKRMFPKSQKAQDVVVTLIAYVKKGGVDVRLNTPVRQVIVVNNTIEKVLTHDGEYSADAYIFATGGVSHPETGSTGDGLPWLRLLGHTVETPTPTIVPLKAPEKWIHALAGKALPNVKITFYVGGTKKFSTTGSILLTHFGLSGPTILNCAGKVADLIHEGLVTARIDLFPDLNIGELDTKFREHLDAHKNKLLKNVAREFLPEGTTDELLLCVPNIDPEKKAHSITKAERRALVDTYRALPVTILELMGYDRAVVADGGVPLSEIDMRTMRSQRCKNAFIVGDLLHISRPSGGYSLQLCWTTGYSAGSNA